MKKQPRRLSEEVAHAIIKKATLGLKDQPQQGIVPDPIAALFTGISFREGRDEAIQRVRSFVKSAEEKVYTAAGERSRTWIEQKNAELREAYALIDQLQESIHQIRRHAAEEVISAARRDFGRPSQVEMAQSAISKEMAQSAISKYNDDLAKEALRA